MASVTGDELEATHLHRSTSHQSNASARSHRSQTVRVKPRKYASQISSSASSISDKSLTSFPSFSPESPRLGRLGAPDADGNSSPTPRKTSDPPSLIVQSLTTASPSLRVRNALFDDSAFHSRRVPGAIHQANDEHIERLISRNGPVALVRQIAEDLAERDAEIAALRRKAEERERALRKIILECGLSNMDLETRLRAIEEQQKPVTTIGDLIPRKSGIEDLMNDAMDGYVSTELGFEDKDATIRARDSNVVPDDGAAKGAKGWKDYIWGGTSRRSRPSSIYSDETGSLQPSKRTGSATGRRTILQNETFQPPEDLPIRSVSRASTFSTGATPRDRKASSSLATLALKLVAGSTTSSRDDASSDGRGRASSSVTSATRTPSSTSAQTTRTAPGNPKAKSGPTQSRPIVSGNTARTGHDRWDTMMPSPQNHVSPQPDNSGPVEMDTILPLDGQPPTLTQVYNNSYNQEFLTDRFGFIYDQRRKKKQREAAEEARNSKRNSRLEMLSGARNGLSSPLGSLGSESTIQDDDRPDSPLSIEERGEDGKPSSRWQDYLKIATFPTELLSHTPSGNTPAFEVMEGTETPKSPSITAEERGFLPASTTSTPPAISLSAEPIVSLSSETATPSSPDIMTHLHASMKDDAEPVKLLLQQLGEVHDSLQRDKTVKWNDFLRKVRAERKREGDAAAAAQAASGESRLQRPMAVMPEATLADGELIGVAGLGNKGKVGRAKWNEFKSLVLGGIPVSYRAKVWSECSGATAMRVPGYYDDLVARREGEDDPAVVAQISMDINRTLTDNIFFRKGPGVAKLSEVLLAYSRRNAEVGYCQGMNLITACLLLILPTAEDAFWVLASIVENILPRGYYDHSLLASRADQQVLRQYVAEILPKLSLHLDDLSIELEALTFQWFLSVFTDCLSAEALFRVWDVVFCTNDGSTFLFQVALALLKLNESQLLLCSSPASVYTYINHQMTNHAISIDGLIHASEGLRKVVKRDDVATRRKRAIEAEKNLVNEREERNRQRRAERKNNLSISSGTGAIASLVNGNKATITTDLPVTSSTPVLPPSAEVSGDETALTA